MSRIKSGGVISRKEQNNPILLLQNNSWNGSLVYLILFQTSNLLLIKHSSPKRQSLQVMGHNQSIVFDESQFSNSWQIKEKNHAGRNVWKSTRNSTSPSPQLEEYPIFAGSEDDIALFRELYKLRKDSDDLVKAFYFNQNLQAGLCSTAAEGNLFLEKIDIRLIDLQHVPFPDVLHLYFNALAGYRKLVKKVGVFRIQQQQIGFTRQGEARVWLSSQFSAIQPALREVSQQRMVQSILQLIEDNTDHQTISQQNPSIINFIYGWNVNNVTFDEALIKLREYANLYNNGVIPKYMQCIRVVGVQNILSSLTSQTREKANGGMNADLKSIDFDQTASLENSKSLKQNNPSQIIPNKQINPDNQHQQYYRAIRTPTIISPAINAPMKPTNQSTQSNNFVYPLAIRYKSPSQSVLIGQNQNGVTLQKVRSSQKLNFNVKDERVGRVGGGIQFVLHSPRVVQSISQQSPSVRSQRSIQQFYPSAQVQQNANLNHQHDWQLKATNLQATILEKETIQQQITVRPILNQRSRLVVLNSSEENQLQVNNLQQQNNVKQSQTEIQHDKKQTVVVVNKVQEEQEKEEQILAVQKMKEDEDTSRKINERKNGEGQIVDHGQINQDTPQQIISGQKAPHVVVETSVKTHQQAQRQQQTHQIQQEKNFPANNQAISNQKQKAVIQPVPQFISQRVPTKKVSVRFNNKPISVQPSFINQSMTASNRNVIVQSTRVGKSSGYAVHSGYVLQPVFLQGRNVQPVPRYPVASSNICSPVAFNTLTGQRHIVRPFIPAINIVRNPSQKSSITSQPEQNQQLLHEQQQIIQKANQSFERQPQQNFEQLEVTQSQAQFQVNQNLIADQNDESQPLLQNHDNKEQFQSEQQQQLMQQNRVIPQSPMNKLQGREDLQSQLRQQQNQDVDVLLNEEMESFCGKGTELEVIQQLNAQQTRNYQYTETKDHDKNLHLRSEQPQQTLEMIKATQLQHQFTSTPGEDFEEYADIPINSQQQQTSEHVQEADIKGQQKNHLQMKQNQTTAEVIVMSDVETPEKSKRKEGKNWIQSNILSVEIKSSQSIKADGNQHLITTTQIEPVKRFEEKEQQSQPAQKSTHQQQPFTYAQLYQQHEIIRRQQQQQSEQNINRAQQYEKQQYQQTDNTPIDLFADELGEGSKNMGDLAYEAEGYCYRVGEGEARKQNYDDDKVDQADQADQAQIEEQADQAQTEEQADQAQIEEERTQQHQDQSIRTQQTQQQHEGKTMMRSMSTNKLSFQSLEYSSNIINTEKILLGTSFNKQPTSDYMSYDLSSSQFSSNFKKFGNKDSINGGEYNSTKVTSDSFDFTSKVNNVNYAKGYDFGVKMQQTTNLASDVDLEDGKSSMAILEEIRKLSSNKRIQDSFSSFNSYYQKFSSYSFGNGLNNEKYEQTVAQSNDNKNTAFYNSIQASSPTYDFASYSFNPRKYTTQLAQGYKAAQQQPKLFRAHSKKSLIEQLQIFQPTSENSKETQTIGCKNDGLTRFNYEFAVNNNSNGDGNVSEEDFKIQKYQVELDPEILQDINKLSV